MWDFDLWLIVSIKIAIIRFHMESYLAYGENTHTLRLTSKLVDLRVGYAKWIRRAKLVEPRLLGSTR